MSEVMLHAVLNMPIDIWSDDHLSKIQRHSRYVEASELIRNQDAEIDQLRQQLEAADAEIKRLESAWHVETLNRKDQLIAEQEAENDRLKQIIRDAREQKPVVEVKRHGKSGDYYIEELMYRAISNGMKLYASPVPAIPAQDDLSKLAENFEFAAESKEFERYAIARKMNMDMHPLHYIFLDVEASTARDAWRSAMNYAVKVLAGNQSEVKTSC